MNEGKCEEKDKPVSNIFQTILFWSGTVKAHKPLRVEDPELHRD